ncbi:MAG: glutathione S-transferase family protein [Pseudomonadota bacterium]
MRLEKVMRRNLTCSAAQSTVESEQVIEARRPMILHHYPMSPFSEKIRLMFGFLDMRWQSVLSPESPPRPIVEPLAGGYRRIPVAQLGADIVCDSRLICTELAEASGKPQMGLDACGEDCRQLASRFEGQVFWAAVASIPTRTILRRLFGELSFLHALRFIRDRVGVAKHAQTDLVSPKHAPAIFAEHLKTLDKMLSGDKLFIGGGSPCYLDFAAYHTLWFTVAVGDLSMPAGVPSVSAWYERMTAFGHGTEVEASAQDAFDAARGSQPRALSEEQMASPDVGKQVALAPEDYALDETRGLLVGADDKRWILARETADLGLVHVHFPKQGYQLL